MEIHTGLESLPAPRVRGCVATWGVFDGVHLGHVRVLDTLVEWARSRSVPSLVVTFDRHPAEVLYGRDVPLVTTLAQRLRLIEERGVNHLLLLSFTPEFAKRDAEAFVREIVRGRIGASGVLLGHDSHFGRGRAGDIALLHRVGRELGLEVREASAERRGDRPMSSSLIREAVLDGRLEEAAALLGRPLALSGTVVRGDGRGKSIGIPTANLQLHHRIRPPAGVYDVEVVLDGRRFDAVANLGLRPTFHGTGGEPVLEVHLLGWEGGDFYGKDMEIRFRRRIRDEKRFADADALKRQILDDISSVRAGRPGK